MMMTTCLSYGKKLIPKLTVEKKQLTNIATIVNEMWHNPLEKDKFIKTLEAYPKPENCKNLIVRRCNEEIWKHKSLQAQTRQKDLKNQRNQNTLLKGAVAIAKVADNLINLKRTPIFLIEILGRHLIH